MAKQLFWVQDGGGRLWPRLRDVLGIHVRSRDDGPALGPNSNDVESLLVEACSHASAFPILQSLLTSWVAVHGTRVRTEKLKQLASKSPQSSYWLAVLSLFAMSRGQLKWRVVYRSLEEAAKLAQPSWQTEMAAVVGNEPWIDGSPLKLPVGALRVRPADVLSESELAARSKQYRFRLHFGADVRADVAYAMSTGLNHPSDIAGLINCSREAAGRIARELQIASQSAEDLREQQSVGIA